MNSFLQALEEGYSEEEVLKYISKAVPKLVPKINKALSNGYGIQQILGFLSKSTPQDTRGMSESQIHRRNKDLDSELAKKGLIAAGTALAAPGVIQGARSAISRALPSQLKNFGSSFGNIPFDGNDQQPEIPQIGQEQLQQTQPLNNQKISSQPPVNQVAPSMTQPVNPVQPEENIIPKEQQLTEAEKKERFVNTPIGQLLEVPKKGSVVASPQGVGKLLDSRNGKSLVEVNGKKHQVDEEKLLKPPKEAAVEALELIKSFTPEAMRSTHHMLNSYDEEEKKGFFVFHNGSAYVVDDISPEEYKELSTEIEEAKTTGESIIGKWSAGEGSRGAAYNKIVKGVRNRKVVSELKKKFRKLKVDYNLLSEWQRLLNEKE